ncbi:hypothetical protein [Pseudoalteromonas sp. S16_S37]|uniref:hypothetical protein n=1 Tax=Pseudoalteromonas sp. S16_S37 TaxID=2720228 RepID=UPI00167FEB6B|nr:hypothetical protein [Pseudoalteromonas sp. S16_S37]
MDSSVYSLPHHNTLGNADVELFISHLTNQQHVAQNIQAQALDVLGNPLKIF